MLHGFGAEIRKLRLQSGLSLRGLARRLEVSAAHLSDIEHGHRRPSDPLLERLVSELQDEGAEASVLLLMLTGLDEVTRHWVATTPGVRALLHRCIRTGLSPPDLIGIIDQACPTDPEGGL